MNDSNIKLAVEVYKKNKILLSTKYQIQISLLKTTEKKIEHSYPDFKTYEKNGKWNCIIFSLNSKAFVKYNDEEDTIEDLINNFKKENKIQESEIKLIRIYKGCTIDFCNTIHENVGNCTYQTIFDFDKLFEETE